MKVLIIILSILLVLLIFFVTVMVIDCHRLVVRNYVFSSPKIKEDKNFVFLTDLHSSSFGKNNERLIAKIDGLTPDAILISGDMFTALADEKLDACKEFIKNLSSKYPIYYANGNHERKVKEKPEEFGNMYEDFKDFLARCRVNYLENSQIEYDENLTIYGLDLEFEYYKKFVRIRPNKEGMVERLSSLDEQKYNILLAHNPEYFEDYSLWGADLVCAGHYHGGLMRLPAIGGVISPRYRLFPKYDYGVYHKGDSTMVLSCGLGTHTLPIRIFNPGEVSVIRLCKRT